MLTPSTLDDVICVTPGICGELTLQRRRDRRRHGHRIGAGKLCGHLDGGEIDLRQGRDRQERIGDCADEQYPRHEQRSCDRAPNEKT